MNEQLVEAAKKGDLSAAKRLVANGADVNAKMKDGSSALGVASFKGYREVVELLINGGAK